MSEMNENNTSGNQAEELKKAPRTDGNAGPGNPPRKKSSNTKKNQDKKIPGRKDEKDSGMNLHLIFIALIILIGSVAVFKLVKWNQGKDSGYDPNVINTEFDTEPEDYFIPADPEMKALQKDDGVTTVLLLGNDPLANERGKNGIDGSLEELTDGKVYNGSFEGTTLSVKNAVFDEKYPADAFSLYWVTKCMALNDYTLLEDNARVWDGDKNVKNTVEMLKNLDMDSVDVLTILYDGTDYLEERLLAGPYDETMAASCCGCLLQSIRQIQKAFPHIQIIVSSPYFGYAEDKIGQLKPGSTVNYGQGFLPDYMIAYKNIAVNANVSFIDNYFGTITEDNYEKYLADNKFSLNENGRNVIAQRISAAIDSSR